jgi:hypothetical protein
MTVTELARLVEGTAVGTAAAVAREARGGYVSDLLSDVMANSQEGDVWVTVQRHLNTVAVAQLKGLAGIVIVNGRQPEPDMLARAAEHDVAVVVTPLPAFDVAGRLYGAGLRGSRAS